MHPKKVLHNFIGNSTLVKKPKPSAKIYKLALKKLRLSPKECIAIEDTQESLNSALKAKLKCFIFPGKFHRSKKFNGAFKEINKINKNIFKFSLKQKKIELILLRVVEVTKASLI